MQIHIARTKLSYALSVALFCMASGPALAQALQQPGNDAAPKADDAAQAQTPDGNSDAVNLGVITVTGYRHSIQLSTEAKRDAVNTIDTIFAEDIGKFPDSNIAEALNRIPGVQLNRDVNGEGLNISVRGLGASFTQTTLNGTPITTASIGLNNTNQNREVDLNLFPTEFFTQLTVNKTPEASLLEGGVAGVVDMRSARPFDNPGAHLTYSLQGDHNSISDKYSPRGALIGSWTDSSGVFGALIGLSSDRSKIGVHGWEAVGWTNPGLTYTQCGLTPPAGTPATNQPAACNPAATGGNGWRIPDTVPNNAATIGAGLTPGTVIDNNFLLSHNPGLNINQITEALIPRLGRPVNMDGDHFRDAFLGSLEYRPSDNAHFYLDTIFSKAHRSNERIDMDLVGRNGGMIPLNMQVDSNNVVTSATFTNAQFFLEARPYVEDTKYYNINPGGEFIFSDSLKLDAQANIGRSWMFRQTPTILFNSPFTTIQYTNSGGDFPTWTTGGLDLDNPNAGWTWAGGRTWVQNEKRVTQNKGGRADLQWGDDKKNIKVGADYYEAQRTIVGFNDTNQAGIQSWQSNVLSVIPDSALPSYLLPGPAGFVTVNFPKFDQATDYARYLANAPQVGGPVTGATTGGVDEKNKALYIEGNDEFDLAGRPLKVNGGVRFINTDQQTSGPVTVGTVTNYVDLEQTYHKYLPSFNTAWSVMDDVVLRFSGSRTLTRPNPSQMLPNTNFSDISAQVATQGNPNLKPYMSNNVDLGAEWYTGEEGYVGFSLFNKRIAGFTYQGNNTIPFLALGIPFTSLTDSQQLAINNRGGPTAATVVVSQQVNAPDNVNIRGWELNWVQPIDRILGDIDVLKGFGFMANYTHIQTSVEGGGPTATAVAQNLYGIAPKLWNATLYWERGGASVRLAYTWTAAQQTTGYNYNGLAYGYQKFEARGQLDLSAGYTLAWLPTKPQVTFNAVNITDQKQKWVVTYGNATDQLYDPGRTYLLGIRGTFDL